MSKNVRTQIGKVVGKSLDAYHKRMKPTVDELKFKENYQGKIIDCIVGEIDDNYIETPETDAPVVKLEFSKEGVVKIPKIKGKTIIVDENGNETDTPSLGCKLVSVGEENNGKIVFSSNNKNLYDYSKAMLKTIKENGEEISSKTDIISDYIKIKPNTLYNFTLQDNTNYVANGFFCFDKDYNLINYIRTTGDITPENTAYCRVRFRNMVAGTLITLDELEIAKPMLYEGVDDTYVVNENNKSEFVMNTCLRGLSNGICDEIDNNKLIRKVGFLTFTGEERFWGTWKQFETDTHISFYVNATSEYGMALYPDIAFESIANLSIQSNIFTPLQEVPSTVDFEGICVRNAMPNYIAIRILKERLETPDLEGFKKWLSENNVEIVYQLPEEIVEEFPNQVAIQGYDDTTINIENSITPTVTYGYNALIPYKKELLQQKEEVEINILDIENNIIPYLMDMEFNLMTMEDNE